MMSRRFNDSRIGRFSITADVIEKNPELARQALSGIVVLKCEPHPWADDYEYVGYGVPFDLVEHAGFVPQYIAAIIREDNGALRFDKWVRVEQSVKVV